MKNKNGNLLTAQEVAQFLNISARTLSRWKLNRIRIGKRVYYEQFERVIYNASSDFHINFPDDKEYFALFVENGMLKYFAFDNEDEAERRINSFTCKLDDSTQYCIVPRSVAEMVGREHEFYQYQEAMADSDDEAAEYRQRQKEIINFIFSSK